MRSIVGLFGIMCGVITIALVSRYGFKTSDNEIDGAINAFLFGTIAVGGLGGHAVAVRIWKLNRLWSIILWLVCASALVVNLSNSLSAIAGRGEHTNAERGKTKDTVADDRAELKRINDRLASLSARPVGAVQADIEASQSSKAFKNSDGCSPDKITYKATREACDGLHKLEAELSISSTVDDLSSKAAKLRERLDKAGPVQEVNPQGAALARLFSLPASEADRAATYQQFAIAVIVELLIAGAFIAFEIMGHERSAAKALAASQAQQIAAGAATQVKPLETIPSVETAALAPPAPRARLMPPASPKPRLVSSDTAPAGSVLEIMADVLEPGVSSIEIEDAYRAYVAACEAMGKRPVTPVPFAERLKKFCAGCGIETELRGEHVYLLGVQIAALATADARKQKGESQ